MKAAKGEIPFPSFDLGALLFFLTLDPDPEVKAAAVNSLKDMPHDLLMAIADSTNTHPRVLDLLARIHSGNRVFIEKVVSHQAVDNRTVEFLRNIISAKVESESPDLEEIQSPDTATIPEGTKDILPVDSIDGADEEERIDEDSEESHTRYQLCQQMSVTEKIKLAMGGDKEWRVLLLNDTNKQVTTAVLKNPRISEPEILALVKNKGMSEEIMRLICGNREWIKNYQIRKALVENQKTPLHTAIRMLSSLTDKDLAHIAKNREIRKVIVTQARRLVLNKNTR
jgi:hypothetical protein